MAASVEKYVVDLYKSRAYPSFSQFLRFLKEEEGLLLPSHTLKSYLLNAGVTHPLSSNRRVNRPKRRGYTALSPDQCWELDLAFIRSTKRQYSILIVVDVFSSYCWARVLRSRGHTANVVAAAFLDIVKTSGRRPLSVQHDQGMEFKQSFARLMRELKIQTRIATNQPNKAAIAESSIRTMKRMLKTAVQERGLPNLRSALADVIAHMNADRKLSRLGGLTPLEVDVWAVPKIRAVQVKRQAAMAAADKRKPLEVGQRVLLMYPYKSYSAANWNVDEVFKIAQVDTSARPYRYAVSDLEGRPISGRYYQEELTII